VTCARLHTVRLVTGMSSILRHVAQTGRVLLALGFGVALLSGCSIIKVGGRIESAGPTTIDDPARRPAVVVPDFEVLPRLVETRDENRRLIRTPTEVETTRDRRGWWFTAQNVYVNSNAGRLVADELTREFQRTGLFRPISREDIKVYMADKSMALRDGLGMDEKESRKALGLLDPVRVGREMGADYVARGQVVDLEMRHSRVFGLFAAGGSARAALINTRTGQTEVVTSARQMRFVNTTLSAAEGLARQLSDQIRTHQALTGFLTGSRSE
jgi:hypothetical protein